MVFVVAVLSLAVARLVPAVYSYVLYRRPEGFKAEPPADDGG
jgi:hypothetical protein